MCVLIFDRKVIVMDDLNRYLKFVQLCLHQLLPTNSQKFQRIFDCSGLHYFFAFSNVLLFSLFNYLPHLIWQNIATLVKFFFGLVVFTKIWIIIAELIKISYEIIEQLLLVINSLQISQKFLLDARLRLKRLFTLSAYISENLFHLGAIVTAQILPKLYQNRSEIEFYIVLNLSRRNNRNRISIF